MPGSSPTSVDLFFLNAPLVAGALLAWSLAAPPGPGNALIAQDAARRGWLAGVATGAGAVTADVAMFLLMWLGVLRLVQLYPPLLVAMGVVGAVLMARFAWGAYKAARAPASADPSATGGFRRSFLAIVTSPFNHAWWLSAGTTVFANIGFGMVVGFFGALLVWIAFWSWLAHFGAARVRRFSEFVGYASAVVLALFAVLVTAFAVRSALALWA